MTKMVSDLDNADLLRTFQELTPQAPEPPAPPQAFAEPEPPPPKKEQPFLETLGMSPEEAAHQATDNPELWDEEEMEFFWSILADAGNGDFDLPRLDNLINDQVRGARKPREALKPIKEEPRPVENIPAILRPDPVLLSISPDTGSHDPGEWWKDKFKEDPKPRYKKGDEEP